MIQPSLILGFLISTLYGALFHLFLNGGAGRLFIHLILGWSGFWLGQYIASVYQWSFFNLGSLHLGVATAASIIFLFVGHWISLVEVERN